MPEQQPQMLLACLAVLVRRSQGGVVIEDSDVIREVAAGTAVSFKHDEPMECVRLTVPDLREEAA